MRRIQRLTRHRELSEGRLCAEDRGSRMRDYRVSAIVMCVVLNVLDGFDVSVMSLTAPRVSEESMVNILRLLQWVMAEVS